MPRVFIASTYWRGSMNVANLRTFSEEIDAIGYVQSLEECYNRGEFIPQFARVYELFPNKPPRLVKLFS